MENIKFNNFGQPAVGRIVTSYINDNDTYYVVYYKNPYGTHNLLVVNSDDEEAFVHGNEASIRFMMGSPTKKAVCKVYKFCKQHNINTDFFTRHRYLYTLRYNEKILFKGDYEDCINNSINLNPFFIRHLIKHGIFKLSKHPKPAEHNPFLPTNEWIVNVLLYKKWYGYFGHDVYKFKTKVEAWVFYTAIRIANVSYFDNHIIECPEAPTMGYSLLPDRCYHDGSYHLKDTIEKGIKKYRYLYKNRYSSLCNDELKQVLGFLRELKNNTEIDSISDLENYI